MDLRSVRLVSEVVRESGTPAILAGAAGPDRREVSNRDLAIPTRSLFGPNIQHRIYSWLNATLSFGPFHAHE